MTTFANSLDPDQARHNVRPDLDPHCLTLWCYCQSNFWRSFFLKKSSWRQKSMQKLPSMQRVNEIHLSQWGENSKIDTCPGICKWPKCTCRKKVQLAPKNVGRSKLNLPTWSFFMLFCCLLIFFSKSTFSKILSRIPSECQTVCQALSGSKLFAKVISRWH